MYFSLFPLFVLLILVIFFSAMSFLLLLPYSGVFISRSLIWVFFLVIYSPFSTFWICGIQLKSLLKCSCLLILTSMCFGLVLIGWFFSPQYFPVSFHVQYFLIEWSFINSPYSCRTHLLSSGYFYSYKHLELCSGLRCS